MIASLTGTVKALRLDCAVIDVGGVGYLVYATQSTLSSMRVDQVTSVATTMVVREDSMTLFGFSDDDERTVFDTLLSVSGIGPRLALAMLAVHTPDQIRRAVATEDLAALQRVPGVGRKSAQRLVLELAGKLGQPNAAVSGLTESDGGAVSESGDVGALVTQALLGLGWPIKDAQRAVSDVLSTYDANTTVDRAVVLRDALRVLGGSRA